MTTSGPLSSVAHRTERGPDRPIENPRSTTGYNRADRRSDDVRERSLGLAEVPDARDQEKRDGDQRQFDALPWERRFATGDRPAESVDHSNHRIQVIEQPQSI